MDTLAFGLIFGSLTTLLLTWLMHRPPRRKPLRYNVHDEVDMILDALEL